MTSEQFDGESLLEAFNETLGEPLLDHGSDEVAMKRTESQLNEATLTALNEKGTRDLSSASNVANMKQPGRPENVVLSEAGGLPSFDPIEPQTLEEAGLQESDIEALTLKFLNAYGNNLGRQIAKQIKLPFGIVQEVLNSLKNQMLVSYKSLAAANDYEYELTETGYAKARRLTDLCSYCGAAPSRYQTIR